jgi:hypothetical protein
MTDCVWVVSPAEARFPSGSRYLASLRELFLHAMTITIANWGVWVNDADATA